MMNWVTVKMIILKRPIIQQSEFLTNFLTNFSIYLTNLFSFLKAITWMMNWVTVKMMILKRQIIQQSELTIGFLSSQVIFLIFFFFTFWKKNIMIILRQIWFNLTNLHRFYPYSKSGAITTKMVCPIFEKTENTRKTINSGQSQTYFSSYFLHVVIDTIFYSNVCTSYLLGTELR